MAHVCRGIKLGGMIHFVYTPFVAPSFEFCFQPHGNQCRDLFIVCVVGRKNQDVGIIMTATQTGSV